MTGLSKAIFEVHEPDVAALKAQLLQDGKMTPEEIADLKFSYFKKRYAVSAHRRDFERQAYMRYVEQVTGANFICTCVHLRSVTWLIRCSAHSAFVTCWQACMQTCHLISQEQLCSGMWCLCLQCMMYGMRCSSIILVDCRCRCVIPNKQKLEANLTKLMNS